MSWTEVYKETIDYTYTVNKALQTVFEARAAVRDSITYERYLRAVEALHVILVPRLRPPEAGELLRRAAERDPDYGYYTVEGLKRLDEAVQLILEKLEEAGILIKKRQMLVGGEVDAEA